MWRRHSPACGGRHVTCCYVPHRPLSCPAHAALLLAYYQNKLRQLSRLVHEADEDAADAGDEVMDGEFGGAATELGWAAALQEVAAHLRMLGLEVSPVRSDR